MPAASEMAPKIIGVEKVRNDDLIMGAIRSCSPEQQQ
jgi:hypothetical protein